MRLYGTLFIGPLDHPHVADDPDVAVEGDALTVRISEEVTITGDRKDVTRWVQELAVQVAQYG